jgi:hypothetical protein
MRLVDVQVMRPNFSLRGALNRNEIDFDGDDPSQLEQHLAIDKHSALKAYETFTQERGIAHITTTEEAIDFGVGALFPSIARNAAELRPLKFVIGEDTHVISIPMDNAEILSDGWTVRTNPEVFTRWMRACLPDRLAKDPSTKDSVPGDGRSMSGPIEDQDCFMNENDPDPCFPNTREPGCYSDICWFQFCNEQIPDGGCSQEACGEDACGFDACGADGCAGDACGVAACGIDGCGTAVCPADACGAAVCGADFGVVPCPADGCAINFG